MYSSSVFRPITAICRRKYFTASTVKTALREQSNIAPLFSSCRVSCTVYTVASRSSASASSRSARSSAGISRYSTRADPPCISTCSVYAPPASRVSRTGMPSAACVRPSSSVVSRMPVSSAVPAPMICMFFISAPFLPDSGRCAAPSRQPPLCRFIAYHVLTQWIASPYPAGSTLASSRPRSFFCSAE